MKHLIYANQINNHKLEIRKKLCDANDVEKMLIPPIFFFSYSSYFYSTQSNIIKNARMNYNLLFFKFFF